MAVIRRFDFHGSFYSMRPFIFVVNSGASGDFTIPTSSSYVYNYDVSSSDGQMFSGVTGDLKITFPSANTNYFIEVRGAFPYFRGDGLSTIEKEKSLDIKQWGDIKWKDFNRSFKGFTNLYSVSATDAPDLSECEDLGGMFAFCSSLTELYFEDWDVSTIKYLESFVFQCTSLEVLKVSTWNTGLNTTMHDFMYNCFLIYDVDLSSWNFKNVKDASRMAYNCYLWDNNFNGLDMSSLVNARDMLRNSGFTNDGVTLDWSDTTTGSINLENAHAFAYNTGLLGYKLQAGNIDLHVNNNFTNSATLSELIGIKTSFYIADAPITGSAIDNLFTSIGTANSGAEIIISTTQSTSGIDTTIATSKGWTIVIV